MNRRRKLGLWAVAALAGALISEFNLLAQENFPASTNIASAFIVKAGFRVQLVAAEPDVTAPVAMAFDETGRLFVAERLADNPLEGRIRVLEDPDGTGAFKLRTIYADGVPYPSALTCYDGGVFVASGSQILYLKDTQQNRRADVSRAVFSGFSPAATNSAGSEIVIHTLTWGPDGRIHGGTFFEGGVVTSDAGGEPLSLLNNDFSFDPRGLSIVVEAGPSSSGIAFDAFGRKFVSDPLRPLRLAVFHPRYWERNPYFPPPPAILDAAPPGKQVFRPFIGETNANWVDGPPRGPSGTPPSSNQLAAAWMRSAQGLLLYNDSLFPAAYAGNAFVADPENHLVHRMVIRENGALVPVADRATDEQTSEFLVGRSPEFRPVHLAVGPEGGLYVADYADGRRGRIFRMVTSSFDRPKPTNWSKATALNLCSALTSSNAWERNTATRLIYTRADPAVVPLLSNVVRQASSPVARFTALRTLAALGALTEPPLLKALNDRDPRVREGALPLAEIPGISSRASKVLLQRLNALAGDRAQPVRYQLALTVGTYRQGGQNPLLEGILRPDLGNPLIEGAVLSSLEPSAAATFGRLARDAAFRRSPAGQNFLNTLVTMLGVRGDLQEALQTLEVLNVLQVPPEQAMTWLYEFGAGLQRTRSSIGLIDAHANTRMLYPNLTIAGLDGANPVPARAAAIRAVGVSPLSFADVGDWLLVLLNPAEVPAIQSATLDALQHLNDPAVGGSIAERWQIIAPAVRSQAGLVLTHRHEWTVSLLAAIQAGRINPAELSPVTVNFLRTHADPNVNQRAVQLLGAGPIQRPQVMKAFRPAIDLDGSAARGRDIFSARCALCHPPLQPISVGGNLAGIAAVGKERLLQDIIEPHRQISRGFRTSVIETRSGENLVGIVEQESLLAISLRQSDGTRVVVPHGNLAILRPQVWSLMPEGLEMGLTPQAMADLLRYLATLTPTPNR